MTVATAINEKRTVADELRRLADLLDSDGLEIHAQHFVLHLLQLDRGNRMLHRTHHNFRTDLEAVGLSHYGIASMAHGED